MTYDVAMTSDVDRIARSHLLQHYERGIGQEDLCFALWRPSTGRHRATAIVQEIVLPEREDRLLHRNASFQPAYLARALLLAQSKGAGLAVLTQSPNTWVASDESRRCAR